eukprot:4722828-Alexandrium_andersonii.AAC.1
MGLQQAAYVLEIYWSTGQKGPAALAGWAAGHRAPQANPHGPQKDRPRQMRAPDARAYHPQK